MSRLEEFTVEAEAVDFAVRVLERDGDKLSYFLNHDPNRVNVATTDGVVVRVIGIY